MISKLALAFISIYLVRNQLPLKARKNLFRSLVFSHLEFSAIFFQSLSSYAVGRINKQKLDGAQKFAFFEQNMTVLINYFLKIKYFPQKLK